MLKVFVKTSATLDLFLPVQSYFIDRNIMSSINNIKGIDKIFRGVLNYRHKWKDSMVSQFQHVRKKFLYLPIRSLSLWKCQSQIFENWAIKWYLTVKLKTSDLGSVVRGLQREIAPLDFRGRPKLHPSILRTSPTLRRDL